jgi:hypothetical protein
MGGKLCVLCHEADPGGHHVRIRSANCEDAGAATNGSSGHGPSTAPVRVTEARRSVPAPRLRRGLFPRSARCDAWVQQAAASVSVQGRTDAPALSVPGARGVPESTAALRSRYTVDRAESACGLECAPISGGRPRCAGLQSARDVMDEPRKAAVGLIQRPCCRFAARPGHGQELSIYSEKPESGRGCRVGDDPADGLAINRVRSWRPGFARIRRGVRGTGGAQPRTRRVASHP